MTEQNENLSPNGFTEKVMLKLKHIVQGNYGPNFPKAFPPIHSALLFMRRQKGNNKENQMNQEKSWQMKFKRSITPQVKVKNPFKLAVLQLLYYKEIKVLVHASKALGTKHGGGRISELTRPFYLLSFGLSRALLHVSARKMRNMSYRVTKNGQKTSEHAQNRGTNCIDMRSTNNTTCFGMCGEKCWCWWWVCGDCCLHTACAQHDVCCRRTYLSPYCLMPFMFHFKCDSGYGGYPACLKYWIIVPFTEYCMMPTLMCPPQYRPPPPHPISKLPWVTGTAE